MSESEPAIVVAHREDTAAERYAGWLPDGYDARVVPPDPVAIARAADRVAVLVLDWGLSTGRRGELLLGLADRGVEPGVLAISKGIPESDPVGAGAHNYLLTPVGEPEFAAAVENVYLQWLYDRRLNDYVDTTTVGRPDCGATVPMAENDAGVRAARERADEVLDDLTERMRFSTLFRTLIDD